MAVTIDSNFISQFSGNLHLLLEQRAAKLRPVVAQEMAHGEKHFFDRLGNFTANEIVARFQEPAAQDAAHSRRMATITGYEATVYLDHLDKLKMLIDPSSDYSVKLAQALGKKYDEVVVAAALGTAATGKDGAGSQAFDSNFSIAAGGTGFTVAKLNDALKRLEAAEVDMENEQIFIVAPAAAVEDLLGETNYVSADYNNVKPLAGRSMPTFRGIPIIRSQRLSAKGLVICQGAVKVAMAQDMNVTVKDRPDLINVTQLQITMAMGAVRMEEARVVEVNFA